MVIYYFPNVFLFPLTVGFRLLYLTMPSVSRVSISQPISPLDLMSLETGNQKADKLLPQHSFVALALDIARLCPAQ